MFKMICDWLGILSWGSCMDRISEYGELDSLYPLRMVPQYRIPYVMSALIWVFLFVCFFCLFFVFFAWHLLGELNPASRMLLFCLALAFYARCCWIPETIDSWYFIEPIGLVALMCFYGFLLSKVCTSVRIWSAIFTYCIIILKIKAAGEEIS